MNSRTEAGSSVKSEELAYPRYLVRDSEQAKTIAETLRASSPEIPTLALIKQAQKQSALAVMQLVQSKAWDCVFVVNSSSRFT